MSKATFTPAIEPVTETRIVAEGAPASVTLTLTQQEATVVMGLLACTHGGVGYQMYSDLAALADAGSISQPDTKYVHDQRRTGQSINTDLI